MNQYARLLEALAESMHRTEFGRFLGLLVIRTHKLRDTELMFGHSISHALCREIEHIIRDAVRSQDQVHRIGDCDFAVILADVRGSQHAELAAAKIARAFEHPLELEQHSLRARVTVGGAVYPNDGDTPDSLLMAADRSCMQALRTRHRFEMARTAHDAHVVDHNRLEEALRGNALQLYLQPIQDLAHGRTAGFEALARWQLPDGHFVSPASFIPLAEQSGLIEELTVWSLHASLRHLSGWNEFAPDVVCSVNISPLFAADAAFPILVERALSIWDVRPERLMLEVTETAFADNIEAVIESMVALKRMGVGIAIDDFGTGYATFAYLKDFPVSELKIDQVFIRNLVRDMRLRHLVASMIDMSHRLGIPVVAEGVEDNATLELLTDLGCDMVQGYHIARPALAEDAVRVLRESVGLAG